MGSRKRNPQTTAIQQPRVFCHQRLNRAPSDLSSSEVLLLASQAYLTALQADRKCYKTIERKPLRCSPKTVCIMQKEVA